MKNEEIVGTSKRLAEEICLVLKSGSDFPPQDAATLIARMLISCTSQAYEKAARAVCEKCAAGAVALPLLGKHAHPSIYGDAEACEAAPVHALQDSLAQETVST
jgi:hypothetical protein